MNRKRPHESPDCRCAACDAYDNNDAYAAWVAEVAAWQALYNRAVLIIYGKLDEL
jgi:hypothetical protein